MSLLKAFVFLLFVTLVHSHSWVHCTDYRIDEANQAELNTYDDTKCFGYPRHFVDYDRGFGVDSGYNYQIAAGDTASPCRTEFAGAAGYTEKYPMAKYSPGQKVCLNWPSKNHVASSCNNPYIPDGGTKIFRSGINPTSQVSQNQYAQNLVVNFGRTETPASTEGAALYTRAGFQRCPQFCSNNDKSMCSQCFTVPADLAPGTYSFEWYWEFNTGQFYTSCWEAQVGTGGGGGPPASTNAPGSTTAPGKPTSTPPPLGLDSLDFSRVPSVIPFEGSFEVDVRYNAAAERVIVVDILSASNLNWYGKGTLKVSAGEGTATIKVTSQNPPDYDSFIIRAWLVDVPHFNEDESLAYTYELFRVDSPATAGTKVMYASDNAMYSPGAIAGAFFGGLFACLVLAGVGYLVYKMTYAKKV